MVKFPSGISFQKESPRRYTVRYKSAKGKKELDIWGIAHALHDSNISENDEIEINIVLPQDYGEIDKSSLYLRHYFLRNVLPKVNVHINGSHDFLKTANAIIGKIESGDYITYRNDRRGPNLETRGTKDKPESKVEEMISNGALSHIFVDAKRQWPANIFNQVITDRDESRITRRRWIDMVAIDGSDRLSGIEIKTGANLPLDLFVQNFDYMIYLHLFKKHILTNFFLDKLPGSLERPVCGYFVTERNHPLLADYIFPRIHNTALFNFMHIKYECIRNASHALQTINVISTETIGVPKL